MASPRQVISQDEIKTHLKSLTQHEGRIEEEIQIAELSDSVNSAFLAPLLNRIKSLKQGLQDILNSINSNPMHDQSTSNDLATLSQSVNELYSSNDLNKFSTYIKLKDNFLLVAKNACVNLNKLGEGLSSGINQDDSVNRLMTSITEQHDLFYDYFYSPVNGYNDIDEVIKYFNDVIEYAEGRFKETFKQFELAASFIRLKENIDTNQKSMLDSITMNNPFPLSISANIDTMRHKTQQMINKINSNIESVNENLLSESDINEMSQFLNACQNSLRALAVSRDEINNLNKARGQILETVHKAKQAVIRARITLENDKRLSPKYRKECSAKLDIVNQNMMVLSDTYLKMISMDDSALSKALNDSTYLGEKTASAFLNHHLGKLNDELKPSLARLDRLQESGDLVDLERRIAEEHDKIKPAINLLKDNFRLRVLQSISSKLNSILDTPKEDSQSSSSSGTIAFTMFSGILESEHSNQTPLWSVIENFRAVVAEFKRASTMNDQTLLSDLIAIHFSLLNFSKQNSLDLLLPKLASQNQQQLSEQIKH